MPKKLIFLSLIFFFLAVPAFAETQVSGTITTENNHWTTDGSPYIVIGNITVPSGITLTIDPGVQVKFDGNYSITVNGALIAQGNETDRIIFTSNKTTPAAGDWQYIYFTDTSNDATCVISYATIEYANHGIYVSNASPRIENNIIQNNSGRGIYCINTSLPAISANTLQNNNTGIYCMGNSSAAINANIIQNNNYGIYAEYYASPTITNNTVINNSINGIHIYGSSSIYPNPIINNNSIYGNSSNNLLTAQTGFCSSFTINAQNNWWGSIDPLVISQKIYDYTDSTYCPVVDVVPYLDGPNGNPIFPSISAIITSPSEGETLTGDLVQVIGTADADLFNRYILSYAVNMESPWTTLFTSTTPVVEGLLYEWDLSHMANGNYVLRLQAFDNLGQIAITYVDIVIGRIQITNVSVSPNSFNPSNGGLVNINYTIDKDADVSIVIQDLSYNPIKTIGPNHKLSGTNTDVWDGRNASSEIVSNGAFTFTIEVTDGTSFGEYTPEYVPATVGISSFTADTDFDPHSNELCQIDYDLAGNAEVLIEAGETDSEHTALYWAIENWEPRLLGSNTDYWNGRDSNGNIVDLSTVATIAIWTRALPAIPIVVVTDLTASVSTDPYSIIPSYREITTITYTINEIADVIVSVYAPDATLVKVLEEAIDKPAATYELTWDGTDSSSQVVSQEGNYTVKVQATDAGGKTSTAFGNVTVY